MAEQSAGGERHGLFLVGQFVDLEPAGERTRDGRTIAWGPGVKVLAGTALHTVRFKDDEALFAAVPELSKAAKLDPITVPVTARGPFDEDTRESAKVTFKGRVPRG